MMSLVNIRIKQRCKHIWNSSQKNLKLVKKGWQNRKFDNVAAIVGDNTLAGAHSYGLKNLDPCTGKRDSQVAAAQMIIINAESNRIKMYRKY
jgi:hypothetical protein